jgi:hypothetical protein
MFNPKAPSGPCWTTSPRIVPGRVPEMKLRGAQLIAAQSGKNELRAGSQAVPASIDALAKVVNGKR